MDKYVDNFNPHLELTELNQKVKKLEKENAKLKKELEDLEFRFECFKKSPPYKAVELAQKGMDELNARLREALEFYADDLKWGETHQSGLGKVTFMYLSEDTEILPDNDYYTGGKIARQALKQGK